MSHSSSYHSAPFSRRVRNHLAGTSHSLALSHTTHPTASTPTAQQPRCHYCGNSRTGTHRTAQFPVPTACDPAVPRPQSIDRLITPATNLPGCARKSAPTNPPFLPRHCRMWHTRRHSSSGGLPIPVAVNPQGTTNPPVEYRYRLHGITAARDQLPGLPATTPSSAQPVET